MDQVSVGLLEDNLSKLREAILHRSSYVQDEAEKLWLEDMLILVDRGYGRNICSHYPTGSSHPVFTKEMWRDAVSSESTVRGYWSWVEWSLETTFGRASKSLTGS